MESLNFDIQSDILKYVNYEYLFKYIINLLEKNNQTKDNIEDASRYIYLKQPIINKLNEIAKYRYENYKFILKSFDIPIEELIYVFIEIYYDLDYNSIAGKQFPNPTEYAEKVVKHPYRKISVCHSKVNSYGYRDEHCYTYIDRGHLNILTKYLKTGNQKMIDNCNFNDTDIFGCLQEYYKNNKINQIFNRNVINELVKLPESTFNLSRIVKYITHNNFNIIDEILTYDGIDRPYILNKLFKKVGEYFRNYNLYHKETNKAQDDEFCYNITKYFTSIEDLQLIDYHTYGHTYELLHDYLRDNSPMYGDYTDVLLNMIYDKMSNGYYVNFDKEKLKRLSNPELACFLSSELYCRKRYHALPTSHCVQKNYVEALKIIFEDFYDDEYDTVSAEDIAKHNNEASKLYMKYMFDFDNNQYDYAKNKCISNFIKCIIEIIRYNGIESVIEYAPFLYTFDSKEQYIYYIHNLILEHYSESDSEIITLINLFKNIYGNRFDLCYDDLKYKYRTKDITIIDDNNEVVEVVKGTEEYANNISINIAAGELSNIANYCFNNREQFYNDMLCDLDKYHIYYNEEDMKNKDNILDIMYIFQKYKELRLKHIIEFNYMKINTTFNEGTGYIDYNRYDDILTIITLYPELVNNFIKEALAKFRNKIQYRLTPFQDKFLDRLLNGLLNLNPE